jgi:hypothetical protein
MEGRGIVFRVSILPGKRRALPGTPEGRGDDMIEILRKQMIIYGQPQSPV